MLRVLKKFPGIITSYKVTKFEQFGGFSKLRAEVELSDRSKLFIRLRHVHAEPKPWISNPGEAGNALNLSG